MDSGTSDLISTVPGGIGGLLTGRPVIRKTVFHSIGKMPRCQIHEFRQHAAFAGFSTDASVDAWVFQSNSEKIAWQIGKAFVLGAPTLRQRSIPW
jgi:hypothetical protein